MNCLLACGHCATSSLHENNVKAMVPCILFDRDSAYIFSTLAVRLVKRELETPCSTLLFAKIFAEKSGQREHEHCKECAIACTACADACHENHVPVTQD